jgi:hypothetical protein
MKACRTSLGSCLPGRYRDTGLQQELTQHWQHDLHRSMVLVLSKAGSSASVVSDGSSELGGVLLMGGELS